MLKLSSYGVTVLTVLLCTSSSKKDWYLLLRNAIGVGMLQNHNQVDIYINSVPQ